MSRKAAPIETVEEFIRRGGEIKIIPRGTTAFAANGKLDRNIQYSKKTYSLEKKPPNMQLMKEVKDDGRNPGRRKKDLAGWSVDE